MGLGDHTIWGWVSTRRHGTIYIYIYIHKVCREWGCADRPPLAPLAPLTPLTPQEEQVEQVGQVGQIAQFSAGLHTTESLDTFRRLPE